MTHKEELNYEIVAELLLYLAENENFRSVENLGYITPHEVGPLLVRLASDLKNRSVQVALGTRPSIDHELGETARQVLSHLTPREEMILFRSFKVV